MLLGNIPGSSGGLKSKSGVVLAAAFSGNPKIATVTFSTAFPDTNYSVGLAVNGTNSFGPRINVVLAGGFDINMGANNISGLVDVRWIAIAHGETA